MTSPTPIEDLRSVADELAEKWDAGMKAGKLLAALEGRITNYDPRVSRIIAVLTATPSAATALKTIAGGRTTTFDEAEQCTIEAWLDAEEMQEIAGKALADLATA